MTTERRPYDTVRWRKASRAFLAANPLCAICERMGRITAAAVVDHKRPWRTGEDEERRYELFWDRGNWQGLCAPCHDGVKRQIERHGHSAACGVDGMPIDSSHPWGWSKSLEGKGN